MRVTTKFGMIGHGSSTKFRPIQESQILHYPISSHSIITPTATMAKWSQLPWTTWSKCSLIGAHIWRPSISASLYAYNGDSGDFTTVNLDPLFSGVNWPDLENIHLCGVHLSPSVFSRFLAAYPFIRSFSVVEATDSSRLIKSDGFNFFEPKTPDRLSLLIDILPNVTTFARQTI